MKHYYFDPPRWVVSVRDENKDIEYVKKSQMGFFYMSKISGLSWDFEKNYFQISKETYYLFKSFVE